MQNMGFCCEERRTQAMKFLINFPYDFVAFPITESIKTKIIIEFTMDPVLCLQGNLTIATKDFAKKKKNLFEVLQFFAFKRNDWEIIVPFAYIASILS